MKFIRKDQISKIFAANLMKVCAKFLRLKKFVLATLNNVCLNVLTAGNRIEYPHKSEMISLKTNSSVPNKGWFLGKRKKPF
jgi:hypothetical protein